MRDRRFLLASAGLGAVVVFALGFATADAADDARHHETVFHECASITIDQVMAVRNEVLAIETALDPSAVVGRRYEPCLNGAIYYRAAFNRSVESKVESWYEGRTDQGWELRQHDGEPCVQRKVAGIYIGMTVTVHRQEVVVAAAGEPGANNPCARTIDYGSEE